MIVGLFNMNDEYAANNQMGSNMNMVKRYDERVQSQCEGRGVQKG